MSVEQQAGLLLVCMQVQQFQIAADAARLFLQRRRRRRAQRRRMLWVQSSARMPWKRGANAVEARCERQERRANAVKTSCELHGTPHRTPQNAVRTP